LVSDTIFGQPLWSWPANWSRPTNDAGMENSDPLEKRTTVNTLEINTNKLFSQAHYCLFKKNKLDLILKFLSVLQQYPETRSILKTINTNY
jgi:hypothetical protein